MMVKAILKTIVRVLICWLPVPQHPTHRHPGLHIRWRIGWLRGGFLRIIGSINRLFGGPSVTFGRRFALQGRLRMKGPGAVIFGDDVVVDSNTDLYTHSPEAVISIGNGCFLNGTRMGCQKSISVGELSILSDVRVTDTDFHSTSRRRNERGMLVLTEPVSIGANVWIAGGAAVLKGVSIGENSVIGFGSVVTKSLPANCLAAGNPCKQLGEVPD